MSNVLLHPFATSAPHGTTEERPDPHTTPPDHGRPTSSDIPQRPAAESSGPGPECSATPRRPGSIDRPHAVPSSSLLRRILLGDPRVPRNRRNDSTLLAAALALAAHGALALAAPFLASLVDARQPTPSIRIGNDAPFDGAGDAGATAAGSSDDVVTLALPPLVPAPAPPPLKSIADSPDLAPDAAPPPPLDVAGTTDPDTGDVRADPLARPTLPTTLPVTAAPPRTVTAIVPDAPRPPPAGDGAAALSFTSPQAAQTSATAAVRPPSGPPDAQPHAGAVASSGRADTGQGAGDGGGRTGDPDGNVLDVSWVRIRPLDRIAGAAELAADRKLPPDQQVWRRSVIVRFDVNPRGRILNVRVSVPCDNDRLNRAAHDLADNRPPDYLWGTQDNKVKLNFVP
ncbi:MAG: hypothetical protein ACAI43_06580 [Phycisphaerae bacterium]|nr:hypothetical protein [Tepidisphaeraceae bacterium]